MMEKEGRLSGNSRCTYFFTLPEDPVIVRKIKPQRAQRITESCYFYLSPPLCSLCPLWFSETLFRKYQKVSGVLVTATRDTKDPEGIDVKKIMAEERWNKRNARAYERYRKLAPSDEEQFWEDAIIDTSMDKNAVILDLGTGTGFLARILLKHGFNVLGVDLSRNMLAIAKKNAPDATLVRGDAERIPLTDDSVDLIVSRWVLWTLPHPGSALEEVVRVLKPDGRVILCDGDSKNATKPATATIPGGIRSFLMDIFVGWRLPRWKRVYGKLNPHLPRWGHEEISCKLRELGIEETTVVHNINRRRSPLQRLFSHSGWEQFIVIFNNGR